MKFESFSSFRWNRTHKVHTNHTILLCLYTIIVDGYGYLRCSKIVAKNHYRYRFRCLYKRVGNIIMYYILLYYVPRLDVYRSMCTTRSKEVHIMHNIIFASSCIAARACTYNTMILLCYNIKWKWNTQSQGLVVVA